MRSSEKTDEIDRVVALAQNEIEGLKRNKTVDVDGEKAKWKSGYATLKAIDDVARPVLKRHGIAVYQGGEYIPQGGHALVTRLAFNGQWIESYFPIKAGGDSAQKTGGGITFARRWGLCAMLNIIPDDAEEEDGYREARRDARPAKRAPAPAGLASMVQTIRDASTADGFADAASRARAQHPTGEAAQGIERSINAWLVEAFSRVETQDQLAELRACVARVQPRGSDVRDAIQRAKVKLEGMTS